MGLPTHHALGHVSFTDIANALARGERVLMLVRHAERPPLEKNDPTFGRNLPLTKAGKKSASKFGVELREASFAHLVRVTSANNRRCLQTARRIARQMPIGYRNVSTLGCLGSQSPYFGDVRERLALAERANYHAALNQYFSNGYQRGFNPLAEATDRLEANLLRQGRRAPVPPQLEVFVTHDLNVACFLAGRGVMPQFCEALWPYYLAAAVIFANKSGHPSYGYLPSIELLPYVYIP